MFVPSNFSPGIATGVIPAPQLLIGYPEACVLIAFLLVLCCGALWLLTRPSRTAVEVETSSRGTGGRELSSARSKNAVGVAVRISPEIFDAQQSRSRSLTLVKVRS